MKTPHLLAVSVAVLALAAGARADSYVLKNVRIVTPGKPVVEGGMIIVSDDRIVHAGAPTSYEAGYTEIDCTGLTAYPGFIDAYARTGLKLPDTPAAATAPVATDGPLATMWHENRRGVFAEIDTSAHIDPTTLNARHKQGVTVANLVRGTGFFGGLSSVVTMLDGEKADVLLPRAFQEMGFSGGGGGYPGSAMARIAFMRQLLIDGEYYLSHPKQDGDADAAVSAIGDVATGVQRALFSADSEREIQRALNIADEFGIKLTLYGGGYAFEHATTLKEKGIALIAPASLPREPRLTQNEDPVRRLNDPPLEYLKEQHDLWKEECLAVVKMHKAGLRFAFSSDGDTDNFIANVRKQVELGLPADAALRAITSDAAAVLGVGDKVGTIEVGKQANLVLMTGDFDKSDSKIKHVLVNGKKFDITEGN
jgi:imidazolonepropionase-like amidohydrolase